jgi:putative membrane protein
MAKALAHFVIVVAMFLVLTKIIPGFYVPSWGTAIIAALLFGILNSTLGLILKILTFPLILITFGLFYFVVNALILLLVAWILPSFSINGFLPALIAAVVLAAVNTIWNMATARTKD